MLMMAYCFVLRTPSISVISYLPSISHIYDYFLSILKDQQLCSCCVLCIACYVRNINKHVLNITSTNVSLMSCNNKRIILQD